MLVSVHPREVVHEVEGRGVLLQLLVLEHVEEHADDHAEAVDDDDGDVEVRDARKLMISPWSAGR